MKTHSVKTTQTKSDAAANDMAVKQGIEHGTFKLEDKRPETIAQKKIQDAANNSPQVAQLNTIQALANSSTQVKQLRAVQAMVYYNTRNSNQLKATHEEGTIKGNIKPVQKNGTIKPVQRVGPLTGTTADLEILKSFSIREIIAIAKTGKQMYHFVNKALDSFGVAYNLKAQLSLATLPLIEVNIPEGQKKQNLTIPQLLGAVRNIPPSLAQTPKEKVQGISDMFQVMDPRQLAEEIYGRSDKERREFLLIASEHAELSMAISAAGSMEEAEAIFARQKETDLRKAVEEALTIKWLSIVNPKVTNIRRPPPEIGGKYDYIIDLPEHKGVPVDPKVIIPYVEIHWRSGRISKAQKRQAALDKEARKDPDTLIKVANEIAIKRGAENPEAYARWLESSMRSQLHEITEINISGQFKFKGIVISNVAYIQQVHQQDLEIFMNDVRVLNYFGLEREDLGRIIQVSPRMKRM